MSDIHTLHGSEVPECCLHGVPVMIGIDEAGRGPVLGPMVYGAAYWRIDENDTHRAMGFDDSKNLTIENREELFHKMKQTNTLGWMVRPISAAEISNHMLRQTQNLNELSRQAAMELIRTIQGKGVLVKQVFVDTVGDPKWYQNYLNNAFNGTIEFRVEKKADSLFKVVSAASIAAKVTRDKIITEWQWESPHIDLPKDFGSGYPSDPKVKLWLKNHVNDVFAFPNIVRFSWGTVESLMDKAVQIDWPYENELNRENAPTGTQSITTFFQAQPQQMTKKQHTTTSEFFMKRDMHDVMDF